MQDTSNRAAVENRDIPKALLRVVRNLGVDPDQPEIEKQLQNHLERLPTSAFDAEISIACQGVALRANISLEDQEVSLKELRKKARIDLRKLCRRYFNSGARSEEVQRQFLEECEEIPAGLRDSSAESSRALQHLPYELFVSSIWQQTVGWDDGNYSLALLASRKAGELGRRILNDAAAVRQDESAAELNGLAGTDQADGGVASGEQQGVGYSRANNCWMCAEDLSVIQFGADGFKECPRPECWWRASREQLGTPPRRAPEQWMFNLLDHDSDDEAQSVDRLRNALTKRPITETHLRFALSGSRYVKPSEITNSEIRHALGKLIPVVGRFTYLPEDGCSQNAVLANVVVSDISFWREQHEKFSSESIPLSADWSFDFGIGSDQKETWSLEAHPRFAYLARRSVIKLGLASGDEDRDLQVWLTILRQEFPPINTKPPICDKLIHFGGQYVSGVGLTILNVWSASMILCERLETEALAADLASAKKASNPRDHIVDTSAILAAESSGLPTSGGLPTFEERIEDHVSAFRDRQSALNADGKDGSIVALPEAADTIRGTSGTDGPQISDVLAARQIQTNKPLYARNIRFLRDRCGWSQDELARRIGTAKARIYEHENGLKTPRPNFSDNYVSAFLKALDWPLTKDNLHTIDWRLEAEKRAESVSKE